MVRRASARPGGLQRRGGGQKATTRTTARANDNGTPVLREQRIELRRRCRRQPVGRQRRHRDRRLDRRAVERHHAGRHSAIDRAHQPPRHHPAYARPGHGRADAPSRSPMPRSCSACWKARPIRRMPRPRMSTAPPNHDYTPFLKADALKGARIGIPRAGIYDARASSPAGAAIRRTQAGREGVDGGSNRRARSAGREGRRSGRAAQHDGHRADEEPHRAQHLRGAVRGKASDDLCSRCIVTA